MENQARNQLTKVGSEREEIINPGSSCSQRLSICHVAIGDLWAGAEVQLRTLLAQLVQRPEFDLSVVLLNGGRLANEIEALGVPVCVLPEDHWGPIKIFRGLIKEFRRMRPQLVHTHKYKDTILAAPAAKYCNVPHVVRTIHGLSEPFRGWQAIKMGLYELAERAVHRCCTDAIIGVSAQIASRYESRNHHSRVVCVHNGVEIGVGRSEKYRERVRSDLRIGPETCLIGTIGRLTPVKGISYLLQAVRLLVQQEQNIKLLLVGDGPMRDTLEQESRDLGIAETVVFLGHREDTRELIRAVDIFVLPSLSEGIPMALLEAMAASRAVIASRVGGIPEVIRDGVEGILVEPKDVSALVEGCLRLLRSSDKAKELGDSARRRVDRSFSAESMAGAVRSLYWSLLSQGA